MSWAVSHSSTLTHLGGGRWRVGTNFYHMPRFFSRLWPLPLFSEVSPSLFSREPNMFFLRSIVAPQLRRSIRQLHYASSAAAIEAERTIREGPRNDWARGEIKSIYDSPVLDLLFHGVSNFFYFLFFLFVVVYILKGYIWFPRKLRKNIRSMIFLSCTFCPLCECSVESELSLWLLANAGKRMKSKITSCNRIFFCCWKE